MAVQINTKGIGFITTGFGVSRSKIFQTWRYRLILMALFLSQQDLGLVDLEDFKYGGTNITAFRLVDPDNPQVTDVTSDWVMDEMKTGASPLENEQGIRVSIFFFLEGGGGIHVQYVHCTRWRINI